MLGDGSWKFFMTISFLFFNIKHPTSIIPQLQTFQKSYQTYYIVLKNFVTLVS